MMKPNFTILFSLLSFFLFGQSGLVDCTPKLKSEILKREMSYSVFLPASYQSSTRNYPVLYLLHGMTGDANDWVLKGDVLRIATENMNIGKSPEMIIIMPDGLFDAFYINNYDKSISWEDFFYKEFIPQVEKKYRIAADRSNRAIAGLSMGGYGATYHALTHKEMFKYCYAMSAAYIERKPASSTDVVSDWEKNFNLKLWGPNNKDGFPENYKKHSIQEIVKAMGEYKPPVNAWLSSNIGFPMFYIDCGDDDFLLNENMNLVKILKEAKIPFEFRVNQGGHTWEYWRTSLDNALKVIGKDIQQY